MGQYLLKFEFGGSIWVEVRVREMDEGGFERILNVNGTGWNTGVTYSSGVECTGTLDVTAEGVSLSFLGLDLEFPGLGASLQPVNIAVNPLNYGNLTFLRIESLGSPPDPELFWTNLRNAQEVS